MPLLSRFNGVYLQDSTTLSLPPELAELLPGCGGSTPEAGAAALKLQVRWKLTTCTLEGLTRHPGRSADTKAELSGAFLPPASLRLTDLGYFDLGTLQEYDRQGVYFLSRLPGRTRVYDARGRKWSLRRDAGHAEGRARRVGGSGRGGGTAAVPAVGRTRAGGGGRETPAAAAQAGPQEEPQGQRRAAGIVCLDGVHHQCAAGEDESGRGLGTGAGSWQIELLFKLWKAGGLARSRT